VQVNDSLIFDFADEPEPWGGPGFEPRTGRTAESTALERLAAVVVVVGEFVVGGLEREEMVRHLSGAIAPAY
jgi:hypothetical protein